MKDFNLIVSTYRFREEEAQDEILDLLEQLFRDRFDVHEALSHALVGKLKDLVLGVIEVESGFRRYAVSSAGARG